MVNFDTHGHPLFLISTNTTLLHCSSILILITESFCKWDKPYSFQSPVIHVIPTTWEEPANHSTERWRRSKARQYHSLCVEIISLKHFQSVIFWLKSFVWTGRKNYAYQRSRHPSTTIKWGEKHVTIYRCWNSHQPRNCDSSSRRPSAAAATSKDEWGAHVYIAGAI